MAALGAQWAASGGGGSEAYAELARLASGADGSGVIVSATPVGDSEVVICLFDKARERLVVYVADAKRGRLKLLAVRDTSADWALTDYNNDPPLPKDIRARVEKAFGTVPAPTGTETPKLPATP